MPQEPHTHLPHTHTHTAYTPAPAYHTHHTHTGIHLSRGRQLTCVRFWFPHIPAAAPHYCVLVHAATPRYLVYHTYYLVHLVHCRGLPVRRFFTCMPVYFLFADSLPRLRHHVSRWRFAAPTTAAHTAARLPATFGSATAASPHTTTCWFLPTTAFFFFFFFLVCHRRTRACLVPWFAAYACARCAHDTFMGLHACLCTTARACLPVLFCLPPTATAFCLLLPLASCLVQVLVRLSTVVPHATSHPPFHLGSPVVATHSSSAMCHTFTSCKQRCTCHVPFITASIHLPANCPYCHYAFRVLLRRCRGTYLYLVHHAPHQVLHHTTTCTIPRLPLCGHHTRQ